MAVGNEEAECAVSQFVNGKNLSNIKLITNKNFKRNKKELKLSKRKVVLYKYCKLVVKYFS